MISRHRQAPLAVRAARGVFPVAAAPVFLALTEWVARGELTADTWSAYIRPHLPAYLLAGGLLYTAGGVIYALKRPAFEQRHPNFGMHEIFHLFVMAGSFCHYLVMYVYMV